MDNLEKALELYGFSLGKHFEREVSIKNGARVDFMFPGKSVFEISPEKCTILSCQTTANDRIRLSFAQAPKGTIKRAVTLIGSENFTEKLGPKSLTDKKIAEAKKNKTKIVVLESAYKVQRLKDSPDVMSYGELFEELGRYKKCL